ncbi:MAG: tryptophan synthase subunit alpha [Rhodothermales bacterium]|nr:tryptophan synthase subunit alpha [Rhodothermales bacterium]
MGRLRERLDLLRSERRKAMGIFVTCGFPSVKDTVPIMQAIDRGGADFIELGMPFSDPLAEGRPIQHSSKVALENGTTLETAFQSVHEFRKTSETPVLLMGYVNPIMSFGERNFCAAAASAGVDGLILPDLPPEESSELKVEAASHELAMVFLIAPNTPPDRIRTIDRSSTAFVYAVSMTGLTGSSLGATDAVTTYLQKARDLVDSPLLVGFGITSSDDAARLSEHTDGFIVGSALVNLIDKMWGDADLDRRARIEGVETFVRSLRPS